MQKATILSLIFALVATFSVATLSAAHADDAEIERIQKLLERTPQDSPIYNRLQERLRGLKADSCEAMIDGAEAVLQGQAMTINASDRSMAFNQELRQAVLAQKDLRSRRDPRGYVAVTKVLDSGLRVTAPGLVLDFDLFQLNNLDSFIQALHLIKDLPYDPQYYYVRQAGLFEVNQRLLKSTIKMKKPTPEEITKIAEILSLSGAHIYSDNRTPEGAIISFNPLRHVEYDLYVGTKDTLSADQRYLLVSGLLAGIEAADFQRFPKYFGQWIKLWESLRSKTFGKRTSPYDAAILEKI